MKKREMLQNLIDESEKKYWEFVDAQVKIGEFLASILQEVFPNIDFMLGWYEEGPSGITFILPREEIHQRHEQGGKWVHMPWKEFIKALKEAGIKLPENIELNFNFSILKDEMELLKTLIKKRLTEEVRQDEENSN